MMLSNKYTQDVLFSFFFFSFASFQRLRSSKRFQTLSFPVSSGRRRIWSGWRHVRARKDVTRNFLRRTEATGWRQSLRIIKSFVLPSKSVIRIAWNLNMQDYAFFFFFWMLQENETLQYRLVIGRKFMYLYTSCWETSEKRISKNVCKKIFFIPSKDRFILKFVLYHVFFLYVEQEKCRGQRQRSPLLPKKRTR